MGASSAIEECKDQHPIPEEATRLNLKFHRGVSLLNPFAATLDQDDQHDDRKDSGYDSNDCYIVHVNSPFSMNEVLVKTFHHGNCRGT